MLAPRLLVEWRTALGLSQGAAAKKLGVSQPTLSDWEAGNKRARTVQALKVAKRTEGKVPVTSWDWTEAAIARWRAEQQQRRARTGTDDG